MSFFDDVYDDMSWNEICYRLPSDLAVNALKRRVNNLDTLRMFFDNVGSQPLGIKQLKEHVNSIVSSEKTDDIMDMFEENYETILFNWLDTSNRDRIKDNNTDQLSIKFLFNVTKSDDREGLKNILDRVLEEDIVNQSHLRSVLNKSNDEHFSILLDPVLKDSRPEVRVCVLSGFGLSNKSLISDHQKVIGLKALAKCDDLHPIASIGVLNVDMFSSLKPAERLDALEKYLSYFPKFNKINVFDPVPSKEEFNMILFAGCIDHNDRVTKINEDYLAITEAELSETEDK